MIALVIQKAEADLLQTVRTLAPPRGLTSGLDGGQQEAYQDADDRNDHK